MSVSQRTFDYCEMIRVRVDNWAQGKGYGPGGFPKDTAEHDVVFLLNYIDDLREKQGESEERVVELEALPIGAILLDSRGTAWQRCPNGRWRHIMSSTDHYDTPPV